MHFFFPPAKQFIENALKCRVSPDTFPLKTPRSLHLYNPGVDGSSHVVLQSRIKTFQRLKRGTMSVRTRTEPNTHTHTHTPRAVMKKYMGTVHWKSKCPTKEDTILIWRTKKANGYLVILWAPSLTGLPSLPFTMDDFNSIEWRNHRDKS